MRLVLALSLVFLCSCANVRTDDYIIYKDISDIDIEDIDFYIDETKSIDLRGVFDSNSSVEHPNVMYISDGSGILMASQIIANATISSSKQENKIKKKQLEANKVLQALYPHLDSWTNNDLISRSNRDDLYSLSEKKAGATSTNNQGILIEPIFFLAQDKTYVSLKNLVRMSTHDNKDYQYENLIEVIYPVNLNINSEDAIEVEQATRFLETLSKMLAKSIEVARKDLLKEFINQPTKETFTIDAGSHKRYERGVLLESTQGRERIIRNLRGWIIVYQVSNDMHPEIDNP